MKKKLLKESKIRFFKRFIKHAQNYFKNNEEIKDAQRLLENHFGKINFKLLSLGGEDLNYLLLKDKKPFGVFRLAFQGQASHRLHAPIQRYDKVKRIEKETQAYQLGGESKVTPKLLYSFKYGVVCEYIRGESFYDVVKKNPDKVWDILQKVTMAYIKLHSLGITHLDATLKNTILDQKDLYVKIFDFEYYSLPQISFELQQAYDFVRIIEHTLRDIPNKFQSDFHEYILLLQEFIPINIRNVEFDIVDEYIQNIRNYPIYNALKQDIFKNL